MSADGITVVKDFTNELTDLEMLEFRCEPGTLKNLNLELGKLVLECIQSKADRKDRDKSSAGRGTVLLAQIAQDAVNNMDPELACGLATDLNDALDAGYAEATVVSFNTWRDMCETQNNAIPQALGKLTDTLLAGKYALATSALNGEVRSDLKHAMKAAHAAGNLVRTVTAIKEALASAEAAAIARSAAVGEALLRSLLHLLMTKNAHQIVWGRRVVHRIPCTPHLALSQEARCESGPACSHRRVAEMGIGLAIGCGDCVGMSMKRVAKRGAADCARACAISAGLARAGHAAKEVTLGLDALPALVRR